MLEHFERFERITADKAIVMHPRERMRAKARQADSYERAKYTFPSSNIIA